ncbi:hypothetical protein J4E91_010839 [Alternaria rosae]|nr:hypothetical protein J4E91_010839 [Alternaria rosae]
MVEFRNRVYEYTFYGTEVVVKSPYVDYLTLPQIGFPFSVLAICKQINHETSCIFWIMCIIDAELLFCSTLLEETMEGSTSARITSLVVDEDVARGPYSSSIQQTFPKLRKLYVQNFLFNGDTADVVTSLSAQGIEVECRDAERYTELEESERPAYLEDSEEEF